MSAALPLSLDDLYRLCGEQPPVAVAVADDQVPEPYRSLLAHEDHMTVTLERFHGTELGLRVLKTLRRDHLYGRKILLSHGETGQILQFGIMRIDFRFCSVIAREQILAGQVPLGHILIEHTTLRRISTHGLLRIEPSAEMRQHFRLAARAPTPVYGRLATIFCDEEPAVGLLEVVRPERGAATGC